MAYSQLTCGDRIRIGVLRQHGKCPTEIAELIGKHRSAVYRELSRNRSGAGYFPETADILSRNRKSG